VTNLSARRRPSAERLIVFAVLRPLATVIVLVALYYLLPLNRLAHVPLAVTLVTGLLIVLVTTAVQLRLVVKAAYPAVRAAEALATAVPLFLLLFASAYFTMARASPASFSHHLTRTDSLYFTVTTFSTVGYGDITATSETARLTVIFQILLDLLALGLGIRLLVMAVRLGRQGIGQVDSTNRLRSSVKQEGRAGPDSPVTGGGPGHPA
jgi:voltage-gated potassium channel